MDRRSFLSRTAVLVSSVGAAGLLAGCGRQAGGAGTEAGAAAGNTAGAASGIPEGQPTLAPQVATFELLTGGERTVPFGLRSMDNTELADADVQVYLRDLDGDVLAGPFPTEYTEAAGEGLGLYTTRLPLSEPGPVELVAVVAGDFGAQTLNVVSPEESQAPVPGQQAIVVPTPTLAKPRGLDEVCTLDPPCGMHEVSLDTAVKRERPVMLLFATPAYCQTAVCGPAVSIVDEVRTSGDWAQTAWIHVEIYRDEGQTLTKPVQAWGLPTEPWLFSIDGSGTIVGRLDGPMLPEMVAAMARELQKA